MKKEVQMYTKEFAKKYSEEAFVEKKSILGPAYKEILGQRKWKSLIDLGCGSGYYARKFASKNKKIIGIDKNINQLRIARKIEEETKLGIDYMESDLINLKEIKSNGFDVAFLNYVIVEISNKSVIKQIFDEAYRVLRKKGFLIIGQVHPTIINRNSHVVKKTLLNKKDNYFSNGAPAISKALLESGKYITFKGDYHYTLEFILNSLRESGFILNMIKEASLNEDYPTNIIIVEEK